MKVIFMGTPEFSVGTLKALAEAGHEVVLAVTQPDKPKGRGGRMPAYPNQQSCSEGMTVIPYLSRRSMLCLMKRE